MSKLSIADYRNYMRSLAERHRAVNHTEKRPRFYEFGINDILAGNLSKLPADEIVMIIEQIEADLGGQDPDFPQRTWRGAFILCKKVNTVDFRKIGAVYSECEEVGMQIIRKIVQEVDQAAYGEAAIEYVAGLSAFDEGSIEMMVVGPILQGFYGVRFTFDLRDELNLLETDDEVWQ